MCADVPPVGPLAVVGVDGATGDTRLFPPVEEGGDPEDREEASEGKLSGRFAAAMIGYVSLSLAHFFCYHITPPHVTPPLARDFDRYGMLYNAADEAGRGPANVHYAWWAGRAGDGGRYAEHVEASTTTTAGADMALDGTSTAAPSAAPPRRTPLPGLAQTYGGVGHLQALLAAKAGPLVPPGVEGGCWDRMFVVFTGAP